MKALSLVAILLALTLNSIKVQAQIRFWGMNPYGGKYSCGTIYCTDENGENLQVKHHFFKPHGLYPDKSKLLLASNGKLYGLLPYGGWYNDSGILFEYDTSTNKYNKLVDLKDTQTGKRPFGSLIQASNGKLYGMTSEGGNNGFGTLFEYDIITDTLIALVHFDGTNKGKTPLGDLLEANNGKLYGMTRKGGTNDEGVLFEYSIVTDTLIKKIDFNATTLGKEPSGSLIQANNGLLYGMTENGGTNGWGVLFQYNTTTGVLSKKIDFSSSVGGHPKGSLMQASNSKLYGMTHAGGSSNDGTLFEYTISSNTLSKKVDFGWSYLVGSEPYGDLIEVSNGRLFGLCRKGGSQDWGVIFEYDIASNWMTTMMHFSGYGLANQGVGPRGTLVKANDGKLYGMTYSGGTDSRGVLFNYNLTDSSYTRILSFYKAPEGALPVGGLVQAHNGKLYGMTNGGSVSGSYGNIFEYDMQTDSYRHIAETNTYFGKSPESKFCVASNGKLYGLAAYGADYNDGAMFVLDPNTDAITKLKDFGTSNTGGGKHPLGNMVQANNGRLYGTCAYGGNHNGGIFFEYNISNNSFYKQEDLDTALGIRPSGSPILASNGKLYGTTSFGGTHNDGVIYEYDPSTYTYQVKANFNSTINGEHPRCDLLELSNGLMYGLTQGGGIYDKGVLFEFNPGTGTLIKKIDFGDSTTGLYPDGSLSLSSNGKLYGVTQLGGATDNGAIFEYDPNTNTLTITHDFELLTGKSARNHRLLSTPCITSYDTLSIHACGSMLSLDGTEIWQVNGTYTDTIPSITGCDSIVTIHLYLHEKDTSTVLNISSCESYSPPSGSTTWLQSGLYYDTLATQYGCDSILTINLTILPTTSHSLYTTSCSTYTSATGNVYTSSGTYYDTLVNSAGCDSIITTHLSINNSNSLILADACEIYTSPSGKLFTTSGVYYDTIPNSLSCDSLITIHLNIHHSDTSTVLHIASCDAYTSPSGTKTWTQSGIYKDTLSTQYGCDSILNIHLSINTTYSQLTVSACDEYLSPSGKIFTSSGVYSDTIANAAGCDSIISLDLTINTSTSNSQNITACKSYQAPSGKTYQQSGNYLDTINNSLGCDSIISIDLTIIQPDTSVSQNGFTLISNASLSSGITWVDCDQAYTAIPGATQHSFTPASDGNYAVVVNDNNCVDTSYCHLIMGIGLEDPEKSSNVILYPNPSDGEIIIDLGATYKLVHVKVSGIEGKILHKEEFSNTSSIYKNLDLAPGVYYIEVSESEGLHKVFKLIVN